MSEISQKDIQFLNQFFSEEELSDESMKKLELKLKNPDFKQYYQKRLDQKYNVAPTKLVIAYLPLILLLVLTMIGFYLIISKMEW